MVSNSLKIQLQELLETLNGMKAEFSDDPEYQELRASLPKEWPM